METEQTVPEMLADARAKAAECESRIATLKTAADGQNSAQAEALRAACAELEWLAVDSFRFFEARTQRHFKRGPLSRKLKAKLLDAGHNDLADRVHQYYLAINVLKHGTGASYRELLGTANAVVEVIQTDRSGSQEDNAPTALIDVSTPDFFNGLATTLIEAHAFLENP